MPRARGDAPRAGRRRSMISAGEGRVNETVSRHVVCASVRRKCAFPWSLHAAFARRTRAAISSFYAARARLSEIYVGRGETRPLRAISLDALFIICRLIVLWGMPARRGIIKNVTEILIASGFFEMEARCCEVSLFCMSRGFLCDDQGMNKWMKSVSWAG